MKAYILDDDYIVDQYVNHKRTTISIAIELGVCAWAITNRLKKKGVQVRRQGGGLFTIDLTGQKFGCYKVIKKLNVVGNPQGAMWEVLCDCGTVKKVLGKFLRNGEAKSCGDCLPHYNWSGIADISGTYLGKIKAGAAKRNLEYSLTNEYLWELFLKQNMKCALSGLEINFFKQVKGNICHEEQTASLDRIDSTKGYVENNVQWVHKIINVMKWKMYEDDFLFFCTAVYKNSVAKKLAE